MISVDKPCGLHDGRQTIPASPGRAACWCPGPAEQKEDKRNKIEQQLLITLNYHQREIDPWQTGKARELGEQPRVRYTSALGTGNTGKREQ